MYFHYYRLEIKNRISLLVLLWSSITFVSYFFREILISIVTSYFSMRLFSFIFTNVLEVFSVYIQLIFFFANQILMVFLFYHILLFFLPSLTKLESRFLVFIFVTSNSLFFFSILVFNIFLFPASWHFFLNFQNLYTLKSVALDFDAKLVEYVTFYTKFYHMCVFYFQVFLAPIFIFQYVKNDLHSYFRFRKILYYFCVIFSTTMTPPDVFSQIVVSLGVIFCCEILIYCFSIKKVLSF